MSENSTEKMVYYIKSPIKVTVQCDMFANMGNKEEIRTVSEAQSCNFAGAIQEALDDDNNLCAYLDQFSPLQSVVEDIQIYAIPFKNTLWAITRVTCKEALSEEQHRMLLNYIEGQFSDGYGEGFEQRAVSEERQDYSFTDYDEEEDVFFEDEGSCQVNYFCHLCHEHFFMETLEAEEIDSVFLNAIWDHDEGRE